MARSAQLRGVTIAAMGSLSLGEILVIVLVVLVVFGPRRLPDLSRQVGAWLAKAREAMSYVAENIDAGYGEAMEPIKELKIEIDGLKGDVTRAVTSFGDLGDTASQQHVTEDPSLAGDISDGATGPVEQ